jgi:hypothetical protein
MLRKLVIALLLFFSFVPAIKAEEVDPVETVFQEIYDAWNAHNSDKLFAYYSKSFVTGDGINKEDYKELTEKLWKTYPDIKIENQKKTIRSQDNYATVSGIDFFYGTSLEPNEDLNKNGILNAISQGQTFLQKYGKEWKIESDSINFELVTVYYGNAKEYLDEHQIYFSSPEQVKAEDQYSGTLYFILPENIKATATINKELIQKPSDESSEESFQVINDHKLERLFMANATNHNELVSATIILSKGIIEPKLDGILYISKRVNVLSDTKKTEREKIVNKAFAISKASSLPKDEKKASEAETKQLELEIIEE